MVLRHIVCSKCKSPIRADGSCRVCNPVGATITEPTISWGGAFRIAVAMAVVFSAVGLVGGCMAFALMSG